MKIFVSSPGENWILDRISREFSEHSPENCVATPWEADILWLLDGYSWRKLSHEFLNSKKVVLSVHHVTPKKFNSVDFQSRDTIVDLYHVPCQQTHDFIREYTSKPIKVVGYWYNPDLWRPLNKRGCKDYLGLSEDQFVIGSFQRDTEGHDLKTPKLEKGPDLFCSYIEKLKKSGKKTHVLLGGWRRQYVISNLERLEIEYTYKEMAPLSEIQRMYGACDLYIVSSRFEGGPQAVLEAPAMKVPIISTNVGMAPLILDNNCVINIESEIYFPSEQDTENNFNNVQQYALNRQILKYIEMFKDI